MSDPISLPELLRLMAASAASSWEIYPLNLAEIVDPLQEFAQGTGLVAAIGQDAVQSIIAAPFARSRAISEAN
jgi:hypothetical protein